MIRLLLFDVFFVDRELFCMKQNYSSTDRRHPEDVPCDMGRNVGNSNLNKIKTKLKRNQIYTK